MARKNVVSAFPIISDGDMSADLTSLETSVKNLDKASIRIEWTGTPEGEIVVQALQEKDGVPVVDADWFDLSFGSTITIDATNTDHQLIFNELPFERLRLKYVATSGSGTLNAKISAKQVGG